MSVPGGGGGGGCHYGFICWRYGVFTPEQDNDNDKTNVEPVHSYYAFHTRSDKPGVKGIIGMPLTVRLQYVTQSESEPSASLLFNLWCFHTRLSHLVCWTWCERHHRNAQVQHLSCRCLALV